MLGGVDNDTMVVVLMSSKQEQVSQNRVVEEASAVVFMKNVYQNEENGSQIERVEKK